MSVVARLWEALNVPHLLVLISMCSLFPCCARTGVWDQENMAEAMVCHVWD